MKKESPRPRPTYALIFRFRDPAELQFMHGHRISAVVHRDISRRFGRLARRVLSRHSPFDEPFSPQFGVWMAPFHMRSWKVGFDVDDQISAMTETGLELVREMLDIELGRAAAMHVDFDFAVLRDPTGQTRPDRLWQALVGRIAELSPDETAPGVSWAELRDIMRHGGLDFHLQPIVSLRDLKPVGFEALVRGPAGGPVERADKLFAAAAYHGLHGELELACVAGAWKAARALPAPYWLSVNLGPELFHAPALKALVREPRDLRRRVFELTEHLPIRAPHKIEAASHPLRRRGARVALDDAGCGYLNMSMVEALCPHIVKLCVTVIRRIDAGPDSLGAIRDVVRRVKRAKAAPLAEGVESAEQFRHVRGCGFELAQGYLFGRPRPARHVLANLGDY
ncbi:MAG: EAL domain-containing protein [Elusimicrobia bacterium]|nr:EAL domain-containing protein [Elusimicrobiota bacterium]